MLQLKAKCKDVFFWSLLVNDVKMNANLFRVRAAVQRTNNGGQKSVGCNSENVAAFSFIMLINRGNQDDEMPTMQMRHSHADATRAKTRHRHIYETLYSDA